MKSTNKRTSRHFEFGKKFGFMLADVLSATVCETAAATCRFTILGKDAQGNEWGNGFRTTMQTFGEKPKGVTNANFRGTNWVQLDSHESAAAILKCFDISIDDIYRQYGEPEKGKIVQLDLVDVVHSCSLLAH